MGNLNAERDWGHARDYVVAMWQMLQADRPEDYVVATGECHSVREFCELAFAEAGLLIVWEGEGTQEVGRCPDGKVRIEIDPHYFRPTEVELLRGDAGKIERELGWRPTTSFHDLVREMTQADLALAERELRARQQD